MNERITPGDIIHEYGLRCDQKFSCINNALVNAVRIQFKEPVGGPFPEIFFLSQVEHAYLLWKNVVLNGGVTAPPGLYRDFPIQVIRRTGIPRTRALVISTLKLFFEDENNGSTITVYDRSKDLLQQRLAIETAFTGDDLLKAIDCLKLRLKNFT